MKIKDSIVIHGHSANAIFLLIFPLILIVLQVILIIVFGLEFLFFLFFLFLYIIFVLLFGMHEFGFVEIGERIKCEDDGALYYSVQKN